MRQKAINETPSSTQNLCIQNHPFRSTPRNKRLRDTERRNLEIPVLNSKMTKFPTETHVGARGVRQKYEHWTNGILLPKIILMTDTYNKQLVLMNLRQFRTENQSYSPFKQFLSLRQTFKRPNRNFPLQH